MGLPSFPSFPHPLSYTPGGGGGVVNQQAPCDGLGNRKGEQGPGEGVSQLDLRGFKV